MNPSGTVANGIGQPVRRKEDFRLLTGNGSFADDVSLPELAHAVIVRSPHAHAHIASVNKGATGITAYLANGHVDVPLVGGLFQQRGLLFRRVRS